MSALRPTHFHFTHETFAVDSFNESGQILPQGAQKIPEVRRLSRGQTPALRFCCFFWRRGASVRRALELELQLQPQPLVVRRPPAIITESLKTEAPRVGYAMPTDEMGRL